MLQIIHSIPEVCVECGSDNLNGIGMLLLEAGNTISCNSCGVFMHLSESEAEQEVEAGLASCPHCHAIDEIQIRGSEEWCQGCGLDPSRTPSLEELAVLWKEGSAIRRYMEDRSPSIPVEMMDFLTTKCGPHCAYAAGCSQSMMDLGECIKEEQGLSPWSVGGNEMGRGKHSRRKNRSLVVRPVPPPPPAVRAATVEYSAAGWYENRQVEKNYKKDKVYNETNHIQGREDTGSG